MKNFKKIVLGLFLAVTFVPQISWAAAIEGELAGGLGGELEGDALRNMIADQIDGTEKIAALDQEKFISSVETAMQDLRGITVEQQTAIVKDMVESTETRLSEITGLGDYRETEMDTILSPKAIQNSVLNSAEKTLGNDSEAFKQFQNDLKGVSGGNNTDAFFSSKESSLTEEQQAAQDSLTKQDGSMSSEENSLVGDTKSEQEVASEQPLQEKDGILKSLVKKPVNAVVKGYRTLTGTVDNVRKTLNAAKEAVEDQLETRADFINAKGSSVVDAEAGSGMKVMKVKGFDGESATMPEGQGTLTTTYKDGEYTVTRSDGKTVTMSSKQNPLLKSVKNPEDIKFSVDGEGNLQWRFNPKDENLFSIKSIEGLDGEVQQLTKSFDNLSNSANKIVIDEQLTAIQSAQKELETTWGKTKEVASAGLKQAWRGTKWVGGKLKSIASTVFHGLMQAVIFTVPNILEANRVAAAQAAEQYQMLTAPQKFGNLTLQIPAFLIPKGSPMNGLFIYIAVPEDTPEKPNNFDDGTLLNAMYYVAVGDQYTPWGSTYIPQTGKLLNLNTGFIFGASGTASGATEFIPLMANKAATVDGNVGAGPVVKYLQSVLGKGVAGQAEGESHVSSWKDWLPLGGVKTETATITSNPVLSFLFNAPQDGEETLPPAIINTALTQFMKPEQNNGIGQTRCSMAATNATGDKQKAYVTCMKSGYNTIKLRQAAGLGSAAGVVQAVATNTKVTDTIKQQLHEFLVAQQHFNTVLLQTNKNISDADGREKLLTDALNALNTADGNLASFGAQGVPGHISLNSLGLYVYETQDTPIAQFMYNHSPLGASLVPLSTAGVQTTGSILKDYVVLLDSNYNIIPAYNARINEKGLFEYIANDDGMYVCSLVSGRTYSIGDNASLQPVTPLNGKITDIATQVWAALSTQLTAYDTSSGSASGVGKALLTQIKAMSAYATKLITDGPYVKNGYTFTKVDLDITEQAEEKTVTLTFDQLASGATVGPNVKTSSVPFTIKKSLLGSASAGVLIYKAAGALGKDSNGNLLDDYVVALGETQVTVASPTGGTGTQSAFIIMSLAAGAFPNESSQATSGITALVSLITGKVFTPDYTPQPPTRRINVLMRNNNAALIADPNSQVSVNGTPVGAINLPMATAYMPTDLNPYNSIPKNLSDFSTMTTLQQQLSGAVTAYTTTPNATTADALKAALSNLDKFNQNIANGTIEIIPRTEGNTLGSLLYVQAMYWAMYQGYQVCQNATFAAGASQAQQNSVAPAWVTGTVCLNQQSIANGSTALSLISVLPTDVINELHNTYNRWFNAAAQSQAGVQFEEGPFGIVPGLYLTLDAVDAKNGNYFYQALPNFTNKDLLVVAQLANTTVDPNKAEYQVSDFKNIGSSFTSVTNPVLIDIKNGSVFIPTQPQSSCTFNPSFLCYFVMPNGTLPRVYDIGAVVDAALATQSTTFTALQTTNPALADRINFGLYQFDVTYNQLLTQNYFAGKQLLLNPKNITSYIYAVATLPAASVTAASGSEETYEDQIEAEWDAATDYWVCGVTDSSGNQTVAQVPISASTPFMVSLVTGNKYYQSSSTSISSIDQNTLTTLIGSLNNAPASLNANGRLQTLATIYNTSQTPSEPAQPDLSQTPAFFAGLTQVSSPQFQNLYTDGKEYFVQASINPVVAGQTEITVSPTPVVTWFAFNQIGAATDTGIGYYYTIDNPNATSVQPTSGLREFSLQAMRAHYGVSVASNGTQTLVLPVSSLPLPMSAADKKITPGTATTAGSTTAPNYMQYLGSITPQNSSTEVDYYYQNSLADNFLMRRVITNPLSAFAQTTANTNKTTTKLDYYVDLVSGDEFNTDGSPRLHQIAVAYATAGSGTSTYLNMTNPLFVWSQYDPLTQMPGYAALFQEFDGTAGYQVLSAAPYGISYDVQTGSGVTRYSYAQNGSTVAVQKAPVTTNATTGVVTVGTQTTVGNLLDANNNPTGMQTALASAFSNGTLIAINTTCADGSVLTQIPSVPALYTVTPADGSNPVTYTQALPGITQSTNPTNNSAYLTNAQIQAFLQATPFVAVVSGSLPAGTDPSQATPIAAPVQGASPDYYVAGLMTPNKALLSIVSSYPGTPSSSSSSNASAGTQATPAGRYYFIGSSEDSNTSATVWNPPQVGQYYTNNYTQLTPSSNPTTVNSNFAAPSIKAGIFNYSTTAAKVVPPTTYNALAPTDWGKGALFLVTSPQMVNANYDNVAASSNPPTVYNFVYSSVERDQLANISNGVQVVASLQGPSHLAVPIDAASLQAQSVPNSNPNNQNQNLFFSPAAGLAQACSLYQVTGSEQLDNGTANPTLAPFNQTNPPVAPGTYIDVATGVMYTAVSGTLYPLSYGAPYGTTAFLKAFLGIAGVDPVTGKAVNPLLPIKPAITSK